MAEKDTVTISLDKYQFLVDRHEGITDLCAHIEDGREYTLRYFRNYRDEHSYFPTLLRDGRFVHTNDGAVKQVVDDLRKQNEEFEQLETAYIECCNELKSIKAKWWYRLFN